jgi:hypothetical protein
MLSCAAHRSPPPYPQVGTPVFRPPEGEKPKVNAAAKLRHTAAFDIYSFGVCILVVFARGQEGVYKDFLVRLQRAEGSAAAEEVAKEAASAWGVAETAKVQPASAEVAQRSAAVHGGVSQVQIVRLLELAQGMVQKGVAFRMPGSLAAVAERLRSALS